MIRETALAYPVWGYRRVWARLQHLLLSCWQVQRTMKEEGEEKASNWTQQVRERTKAQRECLHKPKAVNELWQLDPTPIWIEGYGRNNLRVHVRGREYHPQTIGMVERFHESYKYEEVYLNDYCDPVEVAQALARYRWHYNWERPHQALDYRVPGEVYCERTEASTSVLEAEKCLT